MIYPQVIDLGLARYKFAIQVVMGEQKGAGIKIAAKCLWDSDADGQVSDNYVSETFFCNAVIFGVFFY